MHSATISSKFQIVIPRPVRQALNLQAGQRMIVVEREGRIELIPERNLAELRGFLKGIDTRFEREADRPQSQKTFFPKGRGNGRSKT